MNKHVTAKHVLPPDLEVRLATVAERLQRTPDEVIALAVSQYLSQVETPDEFSAEVDRRREEFDRTGLHLTHEEATEWLRRLARGEDVPRPKAHT